MQSITISTPPFPCFISPKSPAIHPSAKSQSHQPFNSYLQGNSQHHQDSRAFSLPANQPIQSFKTHQITSGKMTATLDRQSRKLLPSKDFSEDSKAKSSFSGQNVQANDEVQGHPISREAFIEPECQIITSGKQTDPSHSDSRPFVISFPEASPILEDINKRLVFNGHLENFNTPDLPEYRPPPHKSELTWLKHWPSRPEVKDAESEDPQFRPLVPPSIIANAPGPTPSPALNPPAMLLLPRLPLSAPQSSPPAPQAAPAPPTPSTPAPRLVPKYGPSLQPATSTAPSVTPTKAPAPTPEQRTPSILTLPKFSPPPSSPSPSTPPSPQYAWVSKVSPPAILLAAMGRA